MQKTILAVDDETTLLEITRYVLKRDYRVLTAESGRRALEILQEETVDLIITDLRMPGMSGLDLLREARTLAPQAASVLVTAYTTHDDAKRAVDELGAKGVLAKPWLPQDLLTVVESALAERA